MMITITTSYLTLGFTMSSLVITALTNTTLPLMTFKQAQRLSALLNEDNYHAWAVDGFHVNLLFDGVLYELKKAEVQPNEK
jgi:hypothetical protein